MDVPPAQTPTDIPPADHSELAGLIGLPELPLGSGLKPFVRADRTRFELVVADRERLVRSARRCAGVAALIAVAGVGLMSISSGGLDWVGGVLVLIGVFGFGLFFAESTEVARRTATVEVTDRDLTIVEWFHQAKLSLVFERVRLTAIGTRPSTGPIWQVTPLGLRRQPEWSLRLVADDQAIDLLGAFSRRDLDWLGGFVRQAWRVSEPPDGLGVRRLNAGRARLFKRAYSIPSIAMMVFYGCLVLGFLVIGLAPGLASRKWPSTTGRVITARYQVRGQGSHRSYHADASYRFVVDGVEHHGSTVAFAHQAGEPGVRALVEALEPGDTVAVYYDPANPRRSVLYPGVDADRAWLAPIGILMFAMAYWMWHRRRQYLRDVAPLPGVTIS